MARVLLLIPSATYRAQDFLEAARALGVEVVVGSEEAHSLSGLMGARAVALPLSDPEASARAIVGHDALAALDAIVAVDDQGTLVAARASQELGLRHNEPRSVAAARDKLSMREMLAGSEVHQPAFAEVRAGADDEEVTTLLEKVGLPCVIKPTTLSASQGVLRADSVHEALGALRRVRAVATAAGVSPQAPLIVEHYVDGREVAVEAMLDEGVLRVLAVFDKPDPLVGPTFEETMYVTPSRLADEELSAVVHATRIAVDGLGLRQGPVHAELRLSDGRPYLIEIAARTIGGMCSRALSFSTGRTLEELVIASALGLPLGTLDLDDGAHGVLMLPVPVAGTFVELRGTQDALAVPGITDVLVSVAPGRHLEPLPEGNRYLGFVFARASTPEAAERSLRRAWALLETRIETEESP